MKAALDVLDAGPLAELLENPNLTGTRMQISGSFFENLGSMAARTS